jgi:hypothetical protein
MKKTEKVLKALKYIDDLDLNQYEKIRLVDELDSLLLTD